MDWRGLRFDWNHIRAFLVTAEEGSLSSAARTLGMAQPTLGRQVRALEESLKVLLFERHGRGLELTPTGLSLLKHAKQMAESANQLSLLASGQSEAIEGRVCLSATDSMAAYMLPPLLCELRSLYPKITVELLVTNSVSDLRRREADIALRAVEPTQPDLIARKLKDFYAYLYATPDYLKAVGATNEISSLEAASFIGFENSAALIDELSKRGLNISEENLCIISENHMVHWELVKKGMGIGIMMSEIGDSEPTVVRACEKFTPYVGGLWIVSHRELRTSRRVKVVFDFFADKLSPTKTSSNRRGTHNK